MATKRVNAAQPSMPSPDYIGLEWVIHNGRRVHVSDFSALPPKRRPPVTCPECSTQVILALGKIRRHHARHREGVECAATRPETALHMNMKFYLADVLARAAGTGASLRIRRRCLVGNRTYVTGGESTWLETAASACAETDRPVLAESWDEVRVESRVAGIGDHRVPDILLLKGGKPVCAIEVLVSHEVDTEKAAMFQRNAIPWAEVVASEELCDHSTGWTIDQPLDPHASSISLDWRCEAHRMAYATHVRAAAVAERPPDRRTLLSGRIVDVYRPKGTWRRLTYRVRAAYADGKMIRVALDRNAKLIGQYAPSVRETESAFLSRVSPLIRFACRTDIERIGRNAAIVDRGRWLKGDELSIIDDARRVRRRYRFDSAARQWAPARDAKQSALAFIESAIRGRRSAVQRSLVPRHE